MEPWKFIVVKDEVLKEKIRPFCWNQPQITTCSELVLILANIEDIRPQNEYVKNMFNRRKLPNDKLEAYLDIYASHLKDTMSTEDTRLAWTAKQCYIALANMMTGAASIGIDSCPIEGFEKENVENLLGIDTSKYQLAVIVPFGYRINPQSKQLRKDIEDVVEYL